MFWNSNFLYLRSGQFCNFPIMRIWEHALMFSFSKARVGSLQWVKPWRRVMTFSHRPNFPYPLSGDLMKRRLCKFENRYQCRRWPAHIHQYTAKLEDAMVLMSRWFVPVVDLFSCPWASTRLDEINTMIPELCRYLCWFQSFFLRKTVLVKIIRFDLSRPLESYCCR